eukprot:2259395-Amphidinium_carterae.1
MVSTDLARSLQDVNEPLQDKATLVWMWHYDEELWTWDEVYAVQSYSTGYRVPLEHARMRSNGSIRVAANIGMNLNPSKMLHFDGGVMPLHDVHAAQSCICQFLE